MIVTSSEYKTAINADSRYIIPKVLVYFDNDTSNPVSFEGDDITSIQFLEEAKSESGNPLGIVSANEITIGFDNSARSFTPTNTAGAYYGRIRPNILVKAFLGLQISAAVFEYIPLGVFRTGDWETPSSSVEATVTCYDNLYALGNKAIPMLPVKGNTTIYAMFEALFLALNLSSDQYAIDASLNQPISIGYLPKGKVRDALQLLSVAGNCNVTANRYGVICARSNFKTGSPVVILTDHNQIISAENPQKYLDAYNSVKISYKLPYLKDSASLLKVQNLVIPTGGLTLEEIEFTTSPVAIVSQVILSDHINAVVSSMKYGANTITVALANPGTSETVTLEVTGQAIDMINSNYTNEDSALVAAWGKRELEIDNDLIQSLDIAQSYAGPLLQFIKDPLANFSLSIRGDPAIEVNDIIEIQNPTDKIGTVNIVPIRITLNYAGTLDATMDARAPLSMG